jgi:hypothetical protein
MNIRKRIGIWTVAAMLVAGACSDDAADITDPDGTGSLSAAEKAALSQALTTTGALAGTPAAPYAALVIQTLDEVGTMNASRSAAIDKAIESGLSLALTAALGANYEGAVGVQVGYDVQGTTGWFIGVVGWNGLSVQNNSVSELVSAYGFGEGSSTPPSNVAGAIGDLLGASYWDGMPYYGMSGNASITGSNFSGSTDCSFIGFSCSYATGTMSGNFGFEAQALETTDTYSQSTVNFSGLPAVSLTVTQGS